MTTEHKVGGIEISLSQLVDWSHDYESFDEVILEQYVLGDDDLKEQAEEGRIVVTDYTLVGVAKPDVAVFDMTFEIEDSDEP